MNDGIHLKSKSFAIKGWQKLSADKNYQLPAQFQHSINFGDRQEQQLQRHGKKPNYYFTVTLNVKNLQPLEAFTIRDFTKIRTNHDVEQNPERALEQCLQNDCGEKFEYLITEAHTDAQ
jgi:hypothetical protein